MELVASQQGESNSPPNVWEGHLAWLSTGADVLIGIASLLIPLVLLFIAYKRRDLGLNTVLILFAAFTFIRGLAYLSSVADSWTSIGDLSIAIKLLAAYVSVLVIFLAWRLPAASLAWPSPAQLELANADLRREIARTRQVNLALQESEKRLRGAFDHAPIGKALVSLDGRWIKVNRALCHIVGYTEAEMLEKDFQSLTHPDDLAQDLAGIADLTTGRRAQFDMEKRLIHKRGHVIWIQLSVTLVSDDDGQPKYFIRQIQDITARKAAVSALNRAHAALEVRVLERTRELAEVNLRLADSNRNLERLARTDTVTELYNRRYLLERLDLAMHATHRYGTELCLLLIDVDHFKQINDEMGHIAGDNVIKLIGGIIRENVRDTDLAARFGGDEFCIVATYTGINDALAMAEKLRMAINGQHHIGGEAGAPVRLSCSIGVVAMTRDIHSVQQFLDIADHALYEAKHQGRNKVVSA